MFSLLTLLHSPVIYKGLAEELCNQVYRTTINQPTTKQLGQQDGPAGKDKPNDPSSILATHNTPKLSPGQNMHSHLHTATHTGLLDPFCYGKIP